MMAFVLEDIHRRDWQIASLGRRGRVRVPAVYRQAEIQLGKARV